MDDWQKIAASPEAHRALQTTVRDLETRGLLQFDNQKGRYDLDPVVRSATTRFLPQDTEIHGQRVVDHFSSVSHKPYDEAETLEELRPGLNVVSILLKLGRRRDAAAQLRGDLLRALLFNVEAHPEALSLLQALFPTGWDKLPKELERSVGEYLACAAGTALAYCNETSVALPIYFDRLSWDMEIEDWVEACNTQRNIGWCFRDLRSLAKAIRANGLALELARALGRQQQIFISLLWVFWDQSITGQWLEAQTTWEILNPMGRDWHRSQYRPGMAEYKLARFKFWRGELREDDLQMVSTLAARGKNTTTIRFFARATRAMAITNW